MPAVEPTGGWETQMEAIAGPQIRPEGMGLYADTGDPGAPDYRSQSQRTDDLAATQRLQDLDARTSVARLVPSRVTTLDVVYVMQLHGLDMPTLAGAPGGWTKRGAVNALRAHVGLPLLGDHDPPTLPSPVLVGPCAHEVPVY